MEHHQVRRRADAIELSGELTLAEAPSLWGELRELVKQATAGRLDLDLSGAQSVDGAAMALLVELRRQLSSKGVRCELVGVSPGLREMARLYGADAPAPPPPLPAERRHPIEALGAKVEQLGKLMARPLVLFGELLDTAALIVRQPVQLNWRDVPPQLARAGTAGVPIVALLNFLVGFVTAFQSAATLRSYGANIYVANMVGISLTRELAPLMTAIIVGGRSGAAFAAELGSMQVSQEIDALRTMGFAPVAYLAYPRIIALAIAAPLLTLLGDVVGVLGGAIVASSTLDITPHAYFAQLHRSVLVTDVATGLIKSVAFGIAVALIGCEQGFTTRGAAEGVGRSTTTTVVACLFMVVVLDTLITVIVRAFGW